MALTVLGSGMLIVLLAWWLDDRQREREWRRECERVNDERWLLYYRRSVN